MKQKYIDAYMDFARRFAQLSHARKRKVGAIIVKDDRIISLGYNGTPPDWDNTCEDWNEELQKWITRPVVQHAERNAIDKLARSSESGEGSCIFVTYEPCLECAKSILGTGITTVYYDEECTRHHGTEFLTKSGIGVVNVNEAVNKVRTS